MNRPQTLVFSGGGTRCLVFCELLVLLENAGHLVEARSFWGTSAGALIAALYAVCRSAVRVKSLLWDLDFSSLRNVELSVMLNMMNTWAIDDGGAMLAGITRLLDAAGTGGGDLKLRDRPGLHIVVADLNVRETLVLSAANYPDLRIADAVRASMSLPIFLRPYVSPTGHYWVDGGVRANFPWGCVPEADRASALGFRFSKPVFEAPRNFSEYILSMVHFDEAKKRQDVYDPNILVVPTPPFPAWFLRLRPEDYVLLVKLAHSSYEAWISRCALTTSVASTHPPETTGIPQPSAPPCTHPPSSPPHCTVGSSGSPQASQEPSQGSFPHLLPPRSPIFRRWSF